MDQQKWALNAMDRAVKAMRHSSSESELCQSCCDAITIDAAYPLAWIGFALKDEQHNIETVAKSGKDIAYLAKVRITWADEPNGRGLAGNAIRSGKTQVVGNIDFSPILEPWRRVISMAGFHSAVGVPIFDRSECIGVLMVYSGQLDAFDEDSVSVLENLAEVIGFGLSLYRTTAAMLNERHKAMALNEEKLRTLRLLTVITDGSNDAIFAKDTEGRYLLCNREMLRSSGKSLEDVIGKTDDEVYSPADAAEISARDRSAMKWTTPATFEERLTTVDGERDFLTTKGPINGPHGNVIGLFGISHDITERKHAEIALTESLREMEKKELSKTRFLAAAGHDMRQPIAAANLFVEALRRSSPNQRQAELIGRLAQSMGVFSNMLDRLLDISKFDAGLIKPQITSSSLEELLLWLNQTFAQQALHKRLCFHLLYQTKKPLSVRTDIGLVQSVLMNLVSNAIKFTEQGSILISARPRGDKVLVQVWDTGIGISEADLGHIFDEFYQVANQQRSRDAGLGLGLSICQRAMSVLGDEVTCRSRQGHGSVFQFALPIDREEAVLERQILDDMPGEVIDETLFHGKRVMLVEDDALVADAMVKLLERMGAEVRCFHRAEDALRHADIEHADYHVVDYMLGGTYNGIQFLNLLRQKRGRPINAVLVTGDTSSDLIRKAKTLDWPVLHKPVNVSGLISKLAAQERAGGNRRTHN